MTRKNMLRLNERRITLIEKESASRLSEDEVLELEKLQEAMGRYTDKLWPLPFEKLEALEAEEQSE